MFPAVQFLDRHPFWVRRARSGKGRRFSAVVSAARRGPSARRHALGGAPGRESGFRMVRAGTGTAAWTIAPDPGSDPSPGLLTRFPIRNGFSALNSASSALEPVREALNPPSGCPRRFRVNGDECKRRIIAPVPPGRRISPVACAPARSPRAPRRNLARRADSPRVDRLGRERSVRFSTSRRARQLPGFNSLRRWGRSAGCR